MVLDLAIVLGLIIKAMELHPAAIHPQGAIKCNMFSKFRA
jgi:hypothetical protein